VEKQRQLGRGAIAILFCEPQHCVLDDVERRLFLADGEYGLLESAPFDILQKCG
jgi:hypothetical protein